MSVYQNSTLYKTLSIVVRRRKLLFVAFTLMTSVIVIGAMLRPHPYVATATLQLYDDGVISNSDQEQRDKINSISSKVNLLQIHLKDREFFKKAFENAGLGKDKPEAELDKMIKDAQSSISFSVNGISYLEITCKSPTQFCVPILNAVITQYVKEVFASSTKRQIAYLNQMSNFVSLYKDNTDKSEKALHDFEDKYIKMGVPNPTGVIQEVDALRSQVTAQKNQIESYQAEIKTYTMALEKAPQKIASNSFIVEPNTDTNDYEVYLSQKSRLEEKISDLSKTYSASDPRVVEVNKAIEEIRSKLKTMERMRVGFKRIQPAPQYQVNPQYTQLQGLLVSSQNRLAVSKSQLTSLSRQLDAARKQLPLVPEYRSKYGELSTRYAQYRTLHDNLDNEYQRMRVQYDSDLERIKEGIRLVVAPTAEQDIVSKKQSLLMLAAAPLVGLAFAFALCLLTEVTVNSVRIVRALSQHDDELEG